MNCGVTRQMRTFSNGNSRKKKSTQEKKWILGVLEWVKGQNYSLPGPGTAEKTPGTGSTRRWQQPRHAEERLLCCLTPLARGGHGALARASSGNCTGKPQSLSHTAVEVVCVTLRSGNNRGKGCLAQSWQTGRQKALCKLGVLLLLTKIALKVN